jgi:hypothetical protein
MLRGCAGFAILATACYRPAAVDPCTATCDFASLGASAPCPSGLTCNASGLCAGAEGCRPILDAAIDAPACRPDQTRIGHDLVVCLSASIGADLELPAMINTDIAPCDPAELDRCVIAAHDINAAGTVRVSGLRPLVLAAVRSISIGGAVDVSSSGTNDGPNASWSGCDVTAIDGSGSGGGAGGSFHGAGGTGGGTAAGVPAPGIADGFHGGCRGGAAVFPGGAGGGAVYLVAGTDIHVTGVVNADGAPGLGGLQGAMPSGGDGGGAGGYIGLDAPMITVDQLAAIVANGGGGGGGAGNSKGEAGGLAFAGNGYFSSGGLGGGIGPVGGDGGDGASGSFGGGPGLPNTGGGGGGGGSAGYIHVWIGAQTMFGVNALISPAPTN